MNPLARARSLAVEAEARGARLFEQSPAGAIDGGVVRTPGGVVRAKSIVVAVDGKLERVLPELEGRVRTARLQMLGTAPADDVEVPQPVYVRYGYDYFQQLPDRSIALGGFRDRFEDQEWTYDATPSLAIQTTLESYLRKSIGTSAEITHRWAASVGYTDGPLPVCEEVRSGVWAIGGYSGTGNLVGALAGRAVAALALGQSSELAPLFTDPVGA